MTIPQGFIDEISRYPQLQGLKEALCTPAEVSVRINPAKLPDYKYDSTVDHVPWCKTGFYLTSRPQFTFDPLLHQGLYYVQDASSMAIVSVIQEIAGTQPVKYLDACAAPGGKTTAAISALPMGSVVVANEYDFRRAEILAENLSKWGNPNVVVSRGDTSKLKALRHSFDIVAVDAPCSGEGMMRKEEVAVSQWSPTLVKECAKTQQEILDNVWESLRPGGHLIYSTCTFNRIENEENLKYLIENLGATPVEIKSLSEHSEIESGIDTPYPCYRFLPGRVRGEGLFICVVQKPGIATISEQKYKPSKANDAKEVGKWLNKDFVLYQKDENIYALPVKNASFMINAATKLNCILLGTNVATVKGKDYIPTHALALSVALKQDAFTSCELDYASAIKYLQRENIALPSDMPKGFILLKYKDHPLGFVKNLGNRTNSLMPKNWRIISQKGAEEAPAILTI